MTDRELWVSVFNAVITSTVDKDLNLQIAGKGLVDDYTFSKHIADKALKDAPEDHL